MIKKILIFFLVMSICVVFRTMFQFYKAFRLDTKFETNIINEIIFGVSISYIITIIITGFTI